MMEEKKGADPKLIVAVQMLSIGIILLILGLVVLIVSQPSSMDHFIRLTFLVSEASILAVGLAFAIGGAIRYKRAKKA
jgi:hypothetical protein